MISVIIPTYRNNELLKKTLIHNLPFLKGCQVIVVNDYPESVRNELKGLDITLVENKKNLGFGGAVNKGVEKAKNKYLMFLNSDVVLFDDSYKKALNHFKKNPGLFAVGFAQKEEDGAIVGRNKIFWKRGFLQHSTNPDLSFGKNGWAEGGASIVDRTKFVQLGGFDEVYSPFYWEDIDLSYRAWKSGYEIFFDPSVKIQHYHETTIGKYFDNSFVKKTAYRNQLLFVWKNITDSNLLFSHIILLTPNLIFLLFKGEFVFLESFAEAIGKIVKIVNTRNSQKKLFKISDSEVLNKII